MCSCVWLAWGSLSSIMRAADRTMAKVSGWRLRWSPEMSSTPRNWPAGPNTGAAAQVKKPWRSRSFSAPWRAVARPSDRAVPMALVPRSASCQRAPGRSETRSARLRKSALPRLCSSSPRDAASTTSLPESRICPKTRSTTGRAWARKSCCADSAWRSSPSAHSGGSSKAHTGLSPAWRPRFQGLLRASSTKPLGTSPASGNHPRAKASWAVAAERWVGPKRCGAWRSVLGFWFLVFGFWFCRAGGWVSGCGRDGLARAARSRGVSRRQALATREYILAACPTAPFQTDAVQHRHRRQPWSAPPPSPSGRGTTDHQPTGCDRRFQEGRTWRPSRGHISACPPPRSRRGGRRADTQSMPWFRAARCTGQQGSLGCPRPCRWPRLCPGPRGRRPPGRP